MTTTLNRPETTVREPPTSSLTAEQLKNWYEIPPVSKRMPELPTQATEPKKRLWPRYVAVGLGAALIGLTAGYGVGAQTTTVTPASVPIVTNVDAVGPADSNGMPLGKRVPPLATSVWVTPQSTVGPVDTNGQPIGPRVGGPNWYVPYLK